MEEGVGGVGGGEGEELGVGKVEVIEAEDKSAEGVLGLEVRGEGGGEGGFAGALWAGEGQEEGRCGGGGGGEERGEERGEVGGRERLRGCGGRGESGHGWCGEVDAGRREVWGSEMRGRVDGGLSTRATRLTTALEEHMRNTAAPSIPPIKREDIVVQSPVSITTS